MIAQQLKLTKLLNKQSQFRQDIDGLKWQIKTLAAFSSKHQIRAWKEHKRRLTIRLNEVKREIIKLESRIRG